MVRRKHKVNSFVASAKRVSLSDAKQVRRQAGKRQDWQSVAWDYFDEVPEIKNAVWYRGNQVHKVVTYAAAYAPGAPPDAEPVAVDDETSGIDPRIAAAAKREVDRLRDEVGGRAEIQRAICMNFDIAGECFLVGWARRMDPTDPTGRRELEPERWEVKSISEITIEGDGDDTKVYVADEPNLDRKDMRQLEEHDVIIRLYQRSPRFSNLADTHMRGVIGECELLVALTNAVRAEAWSRTAAGVFVVPNEATFGTTSTTTDDEDEGEERSGEEQDPVLRALEDALTAPISDPGAPSSVVPMLMRVPGELVDRFKKIDFGRITDEATDKRIEYRIERIARGLNLPVEKIKGHQQTTFANAEVVDREDFEDYLEPSVTSICDALTAGYLRPNLLADPELSGIPTLAEQVARIVLWYDPSPIVKSPNTEANADSAYDRAAISGAAYRKAKGFSEDDAPTDEEHIRILAERKGIFTADLTTALLRKGGIDVEPPAGGLAVPLVTSDLPPVAEAEEPSPPTGGEGDAGAATDRPEPPRQGSPAARVPTLTAAASDRVRSAGRRLMDIDRDLRTRVLVAADAAMGRAMEKAGNRLRTRKGMRDTLRGVPPEMCCAMLGPALVADAGLTPDELLDGAFDALEKSFKEWARGAGDDALRIVEELTGGFTRAQRDALKLRQLQDVDEAWSWLRAALNAAGHEALFDPSPAAAAALGEEVSTRVAPAIIRHALAIAGGGSGFETRGSVGKNYVVLGQAGTAPVGGVATGDLVRSVLTEEGFGIEGYRWVYGPAQRKTFEPHLALDGVFFTNFDDEVLANPDSFPDTPFYMPGDHPGCLCDFELALVEPTPGNLGAVRATPRVRPDDSEEE